MNHDWSLIVQWKSLVVNQRLIFCDYYLMEIIMNFLPIVIFLFFSIQIYTTTRSIGEYLFYNTSYFCFYLDLFNVKKYSYVFFYKIYRAISSWLMDLTNHRTMGNFYQTLSYTKFLTIDLNANKKIIVYDLWNLL